MKNLVTLQQSAFILKRQIQNCTVMAHECYHRIAHKKGSVLEMVIKLYMNKAFDGARMRLSNFFATW